MPEVSVADLQKKSIFIATPMYGGQCFGSYTKSLIDLSRMCMQYGIKAQFSFIFNESLITRARNYLVDEFLRSDFTHLMFIDSDIDFNPTDVFRLMASNKPVVGGPYPKKCIAWENVYDAIRYGMVPNDQRWQTAAFAGDFVFNAVPGTKEIRLDEDADVLEIGTGFMLIDRNVLLGFQNFFPQYWYTPDHNRSAAFDGTRKIYQFFQAEIEPKNNRYLSEDYWFCQKVREMGSSVWLVPSMEIRHHGTYIYGGSIPAMAAVFNERSKRNDPIPETIRMDNSHKAPEPVATATSPTVKQFYALSANRRKDLFTDWATKYGTTVNALTGFYKAHRDEWLANLPENLIEDHFSALVKAMKDATTETSATPTL